MIRIRFFRSEEERPGTKQQRHAYNSQDRYDERQYHLRAPLRLRHRYSCKSTFSFDARECPDGCCGSDSYWLRVSLLRFGCCRFISLVNLDSNIFLTLVT